MPELPSGTVTFLYTDIEGSTKLWEQHPQAMPEALSWHESIMESAIRGHSGQIFRNTGDGFSAAFSEAHHALAAAVTAQRGLFNRDWGEIRGLRVRTILHTGSVERHHGDYVGSSLNLAGRLLSVCYGGQILLSRTTAELVREELPPETALKDLGLNHFRDMRYSERVYQVLIEGIPADFPPLSSLATIPTNLPENLTSFIGREREKGELEGLVDQTRLLTLVGPGGTGKTRLSLEVAAGVKENFIDGVWLIQLAPLGDPAQVNQTIATILGLPEQPGRSVLEALTEFLRRKSLLLLLDNCEHLIEACAQTAAALLNHCPQLKIIASSREGLGVPGERVYPVHPLSLPANEDKVENLFNAESVQLFAERATAARPGFELNDQNLQAVVQICRRLDGIPLAIELAAARIKLLSPEQIADRLDNSFRLLTGGSRTVLPRQQTLRALIDWSYDLLSASERILFRRLAVFQGGWTLDAAETICAMGIDDATTLDEFDVLDLTGQLIEKSMVVAEPFEDEQRYRLLETMRQYGLEKLREAGESTIVRDRHLEYFTQLAIDSEDTLFAGYDFSWRDRLEVEHSNLLAALEWASSGDPETFLKLTAALGAFWEASNYESEGRFWLTQALKPFDSAPDASIISNDTQGGSEILTKAYFYLGLMAFTQGDHLTAIPVLEKAIAIAEKIRDQVFLASAMTILPPSLSHVSRFEEAYKMANDALSIARQSGNKILIGRSLFSLGGLLMVANKDVKTAKKYLEEGIDIIRAERDMVTISTPLMLLASGAINTGDYDQAWDKIQEALVYTQETGNRRQEINLHSKLADIHRLKGEYDQAVIVYQEAVTGWREYGNLGGMARCIECLAFINIHQGFSAEDVGADNSLLRATRLLAAAGKIREISNTSMAPYEIDEYENELESLKKQIEPSDFSAAWEEGEAMTIDQAEDYATGRELYHI